VLHISTQLVILRQHTCSRNFHCTASRWTLHTSFPRFRLHCVVGVNHSIHCVPCIGLQNNTLCSSLQHALSLVSLLSPHQSFPGHGFQRRTFFFLRVREISLCLSYQLLTATAHNDWTAADLYLTHSFNYQPTCSTSLNWILFTPLYSICSPGTDHAEKSSYILACTYVAAITLFTESPLSNGSMCKSILAWGPDRKNT
jgi:hypothetical protein